MEKEQTSELASQEKFIFEIRECAAKLAPLQDRDEILTDACRAFAEFSSASDALLIDLSRNTLDLYRSGDLDNNGPESTVILEESVGPLLELLQDRYAGDGGLAIRIFNKKIVNPPENIEDDLLASAFEELGMEQGFILPLTVARNFACENIFGILLVKNVPSQKFACPAHLALIRMACDLLSVTADNRDLGNALARLRPTDQTTGLASRNKLLSQLNQEIARASFLNRSFALVIADIDNFKSLNARQGYRYGDLVIKTIADDILSEARAIDIVSRFGGEEFLILMPEAALEQAFDFAERCRIKCGEHPITPDDYHEEIFVTLSFGVVLFPEHGKNSEHLLRNADLALLQSKMNGRNQTVIWSEKWLLADAKE